MTDDGMGVAGLLGVLRFVAHNQPRRTIIFNFNNNEEFGLFGPMRLSNTPGLNRLATFESRRDRCWRQGGVVQGTDYGIVKTLAVLGTRMPRLFSSRGLTTM